jgi:glycosyltransferase involved in cell wall biosynthesis
METGGAQILTVDLLNEMCINHSVSLIIVNNKFNKSLLEKVNKSVKIYFINRQEGSKNPLPILKFNALLLKINPDIIHCHEPKMATIIKVKRAKLIYTIHDIGIKTTYFNRYNSLIAISDAVKADAKLKIKYDVKTIYNGISNELFKQRKSHSLDKNTSIKLVQISRLVHEKKGQDILLRSLSKFIKTYNNNITLDIIGSGESLNFLIELTKTLDIEKNVAFLGEKDRNWIYNNLCNYHMLVQPSRYEGFGLTLIEGFAAGLLVLASDIDGPSEIIDKTERGFLFKNENTDDLARVLLEIFQLYINNEVPKLITSSPNVAESIYSIKSCSRKYLQEYNSLLSS